MPLTHGSGSRRPKNIRVRRIRIWICTTDFCKRWRREACVVDYQNIAKYVLGIYLTLDRNSKIIDTPGEGNEIDMAKVTEHLC